MRSVVTLASRSELPLTLLRTHAHTHTRTRTGTQPGGTALQVQRSQQSPEGPRQMQDAGPRHDSAYTDPHPSHQVEQAHKPCPHTTRPWRLVSSRSGITSFRVAHYASPQRRCDRSNPSRRPDAAEGLSRSPKRAVSSSPSFPRSPARPSRPWASAISSDRAWHQCSVIGCADT